MNHSTTMIQENTGGLMVHPELQLELYANSRLGSFWNHRPLPGIHWRIYHNDGPGAGLILPDGRRVELRSNFLYVLPPHPSVASWCTGTPRQLYIHFRINNCRAVSEPVYQLPITPETQVLLNRLECGMKNDLLAAATQFSAIAVISDALASLPAGTLLIGKSDVRIAKACDMLREHPETQWSNGMLAEYFGFSTNAFARLFRQVMGISPYYYLQTIRYDIAARLVENNDLSNKEICERIGINDPFHFSREFKRIHERSPAHYRAFLRK